MCRDGFGFSAALQHEELRKNGHWLQIDTESPQNFQECEFRMDEESKDKWWKDEELDSERVLFSVQGWLKWGLEKWMKEN